MLFSASSASVMLPLVQASLEPLEGYEDAKLEARPYDLPDSRRLLASQLVKRVFHGLQTSQDLAILSLIR
jgi:hypothetical protein